MAKLKKQNLYKYDTKYKNTSYMGLKFSYKSRLKRPNHLLQYI